MAEFARAGAFDLFDADDVDRRGGFGGGTVLGATAEYLDFVEVAGLGLGGRVLGEGGHRDGKREGEGGEGGCDAAMASAG